MVSGQVSQAQFAAAWLSARNNKPLHHGGSETSNRVVYAHSCPDSERAVMSLRTPYVPASEDEGRSDSPCMLRSSGPSRPQSPDRSETFVGKVEEWEIEQGEMFNFNVTIDRSAEDPIILELKQRIVELQVSNAKLQAEQTSTQHTSDSFSWQEMLNIFAVFNCVSPLQYLAHAYWTTMASMPSPNGHRMAASTTLGKLQIFSSGQSPLHADQTLVSPSVETNSSIPNRESPETAPAADPFNPFEAVITNNANSFFTLAQLSAWSHDRSKVIGQFCTNCQLHQRICSCPWGLFGVATLEWRTTMRVDLLEEYWRCYAAARARHIRRVARPASARNIHGPDQHHRNSKADPVDAPEYGPMNHKDLVHEVQSIYNGLIMVEQMSLKVLQGRRPSNKGACVSDEQWQALIALHRTLLHEHNDFFLATHQSSASSVLSKTGDEIQPPSDWSRYRSAANAANMRDRTIWSNIARMWCSRGCCRQVP